MAEHSSSEDGVSRRGFLAASAGAAALAGISWAPAGAVPWGSASTIAPPPGFPSDIPLSQQAYANWSREIMLDSVWTATARHSDDVVTLANWAFDNGYTVRAKGTMHGWSPLTVVPGAPSDRVLLVDTMANLNSVVVQHGTPATVTAGAGASIEAILTALEREGLGWANSPAIGELSIAGALAIGAHGATYPAVGETITPGQSYGSLSNLITEITVVAWDEGINRYALKTFHRSDVESTAFLTHLGRTFVTSVTLQAGENYRLRCQSFTDIPWQELFAAPGSPGRTYESFVEKSGRVAHVSRHANTCRRHVWRHRPRSKAFGLPRVERTAYKLLHPDAFRGRLPLGWCTGSSEPPSAPLSDAVGSRIPCTDYRDSGARHEDVRSLAHDLARRSRGRSRDHQAVQHRPSRPRDDELAERTNDALRVAGAVSRQHAVRSASLRCRR
nr:cholesterol oxidase substrate-binding domain-containing protein [Rhodococcus qingshengii]